MGSSLQEVEEPSAFICCVIALHSLIVEYHYPCSRRAYHTFPQEKCQLLIPSVVVKFVLIGVQSKCIPPFISGLKFVSTASG